jgi:hypothetical protein
VKALRDDGAAVASPKRGEGVPVRAVESLAQLA